MQTWAWLNFLGSLALSTVSVCCIVMLVKSSSFVVNDSLLLVFIVLLLAEMPIEESYQHRFVWVVFLYTVTNALGEEGRMCMLK